MLNPHKILQLLVPMDPNVSRTGCVQALQGSHVLGRLQHADSGDGQLGAEAERVAAAAAIFPRVALEMQPGDVCFTHSCLIHGSEPNDSADERFNMVIGFNGRSNQPNPRIIVDNVSVVPH
jgi:ectoine hydroxylase